MQSHLVLYSFCQPTQPQTQHFSGVRRKIFPVDSLVVLAINFSARFRVDTGSSVSFTVTPALTVFHAGLCTWAASAAGYPRLPSLKSHRCGTGETKPGVWPAGEDGHGKVSNSSSQEGSGQCFPNKTFAI